MPKAEVHGITYQWGEPKHKKRRALIGCYERMVDLFQSTARFKEKALADGDLELYQRSEDRFREQAENILTELVTGMNGLIESAHINEGVPLQLDVDHWQSVVNGDKGEGHLDQLVLKMFPRMAEMLGSGDGVSPSGKKKASETDSLSKPEDQDSPPPADTVEPSSQTASADS